MRIPVSFTQCPEATLEIDELLDNFEQSWAADDQPPDLFECLKRAAPEFRKELAGELIEIDIERRWRTGKGDQRSVGDYLRELPDIAFSSAEIVELLQTEFVVRNTWGDCPQPSAITVVGTCDTAIVQPALERARQQVRWPSIRFLVNETVIADVRLDRPTEIGRQSKNEPVPVSIIDQPEYQ